MPKPTHVPIPSAALEAVENASHDVALPDFALPRVPDHPTPEGPEELAMVPEGHPAPQGLAHLPKIGFPSLDLPEHAMAEIDPPMGHLPDFISDFS